MSLIYLQLIPVTFIIVGLVNSGFLYMAENKKTSFRLLTKCFLLMMSYYWCHSLVPVCVGVRLAATPGSSATMPRWRFVNTRCTAWKWDAPTTSASVPWTAPASAGRPASPTKWPPSTTPRARGCKVLMKVNAKHKPAGYDCFLTVSAAVVSCNSD